MPCRTAIAALGALFAALHGATAHAEVTERSILAGFVGGIDFGDDGGDFSRDGECDDLRFAGEGMTDTPLLPEDIFRDASDCRAAFEANKIALAPLFVRLSGASEIVWGDDTSEFARDGECDDLRFEGPGLTFTPLLADDIGHDASDCRAAYEAGQLMWRSGPLGRLDHPVGFV